MELIEGIETRRSVRAFKATPVPRNILEKILKVAQSSPSAINSQPWEVAVVTGKKKEELSRILCSLAESNVASSPDLQPNRSWPEELEKRIHEHREARFESSRIDLEDEKQKKQFRLLNYQFYGAPCAIYLLMDRELLISAVFDLGLFAQSLILAAHSYGLGSCLQLSLSSYADNIHEFLQIPKTKRLVIGISIGYPDMKASINSFKSTRIKLEDFVHWYS